MTKSTKLYFFLIFILALCGASNFYLPLGNFDMGPLPAARWVMALAAFGLVFVLYGTLGYIGIRLSRKLGIPDLLDKKVTNRQRFLIPLFIGIGVGLFVIIGNIIMAKMNPLGGFPHPPFPASLVASIAAGIGEENMFRLFLIPFWVWIISSVILKKRWKIQIYWVVSVFAAVAFALGHLPSLMVVLKLKSVSEIPGIMLFMIVFLNGTLSIFASKYMLKYGFLAAVGIHFWADVIWHVIYPLI